jgi:protocatechuate 3,4-dioxygenase alpha subunit
VSLKQTPSQTVGPFFAIGLASGQYGYDHAGIGSGTVFSDAFAGERIRIVGRVLDGAGDPVSDALIETWQADGDGRYLHSPGAGFGRVGTGTDFSADFAFETVKPGRVDGIQAPHINVIVFMRGLLSHAYTRLYFPDEAERNRRDPVLMSVPADRRDTLVARREADGRYRFDIVMQGEDETVFFDV